MLASLGAELLKIRKRPSTWVLALIWLAIIVLLNYTLTYALLSSAPPPSFPEGTPKKQQEQLQQQQEQFQEQQLRFLYPENLVPNLIPGYPNVGAPIALILGALAVGSEYGWSTFKTVLTQRPGRTALFFGKLLALGVVLALLVVLTFATAAASSLVVAVLAGAPVKGAPLGELVRALGAGFLILTTWAAFGALLATLLRSTALSIGIGLVYSLVLETVIFNLPIRNESFTNTRDFFPGQNSSSLADSFSEQAPPPGSHPRRHPSTLHRLRSSSSPIPPRSSSSPLWYFAAVMWSEGYRFQASGFISRPFEQDRVRACRQHEASCTIVIPAEAGMKSSGRGSVGNGGLSRAD